VEAGGIPGNIQWDFDTKFIAGSARQLLLERCIILQAAPGGQQSQNGLTESHWKNIIIMARAILVDCGIPKRLWFFAIHHTVRYQAILYPIFIHGYFRRVRDGSCDRLQFKPQFEPQSQPGITISHSELANSLMF
jgi:hypothetical protein